MTVVYGSRVLGAPTSMVRPAPTADLTAHPAPPQTSPGKGEAVVLLRALLGEALRHRRQDQGRTLREVSSRARVSLGYLSEVERGQKEASSELLSAICGALDVPLSLVLRDVSDQLAVTEMPQDAEDLAPLAGQPLDEVHVPGSAAASRLQVGAAA